MAAIIYFVKDLLFSSKIREAASQAGLQAEPFRDPASLVEAARQAKLVVIDLRLPNALEVLDALAKDDLAKSVLSVGFIDHEKVDVMDLAAQKGCKKVLAKGRFSSELPMIVADLAG
jgi:CheY-like chemotaxis protein